MIRRFFFPGRRSDSGYQVQQWLKKPAENEKELMPVDEYVNFLEGGYLPNGNILFFCHSTCRKFNFLN